MRRYDKDAFNRSRLANKVAERSIRQVGTGALLYQCLAPSASRALTQAVWSGAYLTNADLEFSDLSNANTNGGRAPGASFFHSKIRSAMFFWADLSNARLEACTIDGCSFAFAKMNGADFRQSKVTDTTFACASLAGANFANAVMRRTWFGDANLTGADFTEADLTGCCFSEADLTDAKGIVDAGVRSDGMRIVGWAKNNKLNVLIGGAHSMSYQTAREAYGGKSRNTKRGGSDFINDLYRETRVFLEHIRWAATIKKMIEG